MEEGFEVVPENKLDFVQNVVSKEDCVQLKEVTPEPSNLIRDNKSEDEAGVAIAKSLIHEDKLIPPPGPEPIEADAKKTAKALTPEPIPTPQPIGSLAPDSIKARTPELIKDITSPGPECEPIGSVEDNTKEGGLEVNE